MQKKLLLLIVVVCTLIFAGSVLAQPFSAKWLIKYDGYLQEDATGAVLADTLIVVNNGHGPDKTMPVWIEVFDKYGTLVAEGTLYNGGAAFEDNNIPGDGYGWITLGMLVTGPTTDPWGIAGGQKFSYKIYTGSSKPPIVEVKQVIYTDLQTYPSEAIWNAANIKTWAETCLGGLGSPGVLKLPKKYQWGKKADKAAP